MSRIKAAVSLCLAAATVLASTAPIGTEDVELRDLDVTGWDCANQMDGSAKTQDGIERNRMKNRWPPGDPTPIICEITPRTERAIYQNNVRIQSLTEFFRLQDMSYQATGHDACKVRVTGYLLWDDDHNGSADVGSTIEHFNTNGFHNPWRSRRWR